MAKSYLLLTLSFLASLISIDASAQDTDVKDENKLSLENTVDTNRCIITDDIVSYRVESDIAVRLFMRNEQQILLILKRQCPQLYFQRYMSYTPMDGRICAGLDKIKTRSGMACNIESITPAPEKTTPPGRTQR